MNEKNFKIPLVIVTLYGLYNVIFPISPMLFWDQCVYVLHSMFFAGQEISYSELSFRSPLLSIITSPLALMSVKPIVYKYVAIFIALLLPFSALYAFRFRLKEQIDKYILLALLFSNRLLQYEAKYFLTDIPSVVLLLISFGLLENKTKKYSFYSGIVAGLGILMRHGNITVIPLYFIYLFYQYRRRDMVYFLSAFIFTLLPYQTWIFLEFKNPFYNFNAARLEGVRNATYSMSKFGQLWQSFGYLTVGVSFLGLFLRKKLSLVLIIIYLFIIIPFNPENLRFLLPILPFVYLGYFSFKEKVSKTTGIITLAFLFTESYMLNIKWRKKLDDISIESISWSQKVSEHISKKYSEYEYIVTADIYPTLAYYTKKKIITLSSIYIAPGEFKYVDKSALEDKNALIVFKKGSQPGITYFKNNKYFKLLEKYEGFFIYKYTGGLKENFKQFRAIRIFNNYYKGYSGRGFLELDENNNVSQFLLEYNISPQFIKDNSLENCNVGNSIRFNNIKNVQIVETAPEKVVIILKPNRLGTCENIVVDFRVSYEQIRNFIN